MLTAKQALELADYWAEQDHWASENIAKAIQQEAEAGHTCINTGPLEPADLAMLQSAGYICSQRPHGGFIVSWFS